MPTHDPTPEQLCDLAERTARLVAPQLRSAHALAQHHTETKSTATDLVTDTDRAVEVAIVEHLLAQRPEDGVLGEEGADRPGTSGVRWIIDPIDGTTNFFYGLGGFNTSIAAAVDGEVVAGVVMDPIRDELFAATIGGGATCNGEPIRCRRTTELALSLVATGFAYRAERRVEQARVLAALIGEVRDVRRLGAAALDLCLVAAGRVDAYFESGLKPWDRAAGTLIAREAGARVEGLDGDAPSERFVVAAAPDVFDALVERLRALDAAG